MRDGTRSNRCGVGGGGGRECGWGCKGGGGRGDLGPEAVAPLCEGRGMWVWDAVWEVVRGGRGVWDVACGARDKRSRRCGRWGADVFGGRKIVTWRAQCGKLNFAYAARPQHWFCNIHVHTRWSMSTALASGYEGQTSNSVGDGDKIKKRSADVRTCSDWTCWSLLK